MLLLTGAFAVEWVDSLDLDRMLKDRGYQQQIVITYVAADQPTFLYIYGSGKLLTQPVPSSGAVDLVATCAAAITSDDLKHLLQTMQARHFFDLPKRSYFVLYAGPISVGDLAEETKLHGIYISDGKKITNRSFGTGKYGDEQLSIPEDFAAVEHEILQLRDRALDSAPGKPCKLAPRIKWPN